MNSEISQKRPIVVLAFGPSFSPWLAATYEPLIDAFNIIGLTSDPSINSDIARLVPTSHEMTQRLPGIFRVMLDQLLYRAWPDYNKIRGLASHIVDADIVHTVETFSGPSLQVAKMKKNHCFRHVVTVWENIARRQAWHPHIRNVQAHVIRSADHFIAISERARTALLLEGVDADRISVIGPGMINPTEFERNGPTGSYFRFLFVGKKQRSKGVEELLLALWLARQDSELAHMNFSLTFLGVEVSKGPYSKLIRKYNLDELITEIPFVPHDEILAHYRNADALLMPSKITPLWQEQWGMVFMEAMSQGLPIITTHSGSISEVASDAALYAQPNDHHTLYLQIKKLVLEPGLWQKLSDSGLKTAGIRFDAKTVAQKIENVYNELLSFKKKN